MFIEARRSVFYLPNYCTVHVLTIPQCCPNSSAIMTHCLTHITRHNESILDVPSLLTSAYYPSQYGRLR